MDDMMTYDTIQLQLWVLIRQDMTIVHTLSSTAGAAHIQNLPIATHTFQLTFCLHFFLYSPPQTIHVCHTQGFSRPVPQCKIGWKAPKTWKMSKKNAENSNSIKEMSLFQPIFGRGATKRFSDSSKNFPGQTKHLPALSQTFCNTLFIHTLTPFIPRNLFPAQL